MNNPDHISANLKKKQFFGLEYLNSLMWIRDPGWKKVGSGIRDARSLNYSFLSPTGADAAEDAAEMVAAAVWCQLWIRRQAAHL